MYTARDVARRNVVCIPERATVGEAIGTLLNSRCSGAPVTDGEGRLVGVISEFQLMEAVYDPAIKSQPVSSLMTREVVTVGEETLLSEIARLFIVHRIRRVPVIEAGRLTGVVSRGDLLRYALESGDAIERFYAETETPCEAGSQ